MRTLATLALAWVLLAPLAHAGAREAPVVPRQKIVLFDGKTLDGWHIQGDKATWSVKDGVIHCTGRPSGYIRTEKSYANYILRVEWRWPERGGNAGVLVHMSGPDRVWPKSLECQGQSQHAGDFWEIGGIEFNEHKSPAGRRVRGRNVHFFDPHNEKKLGEWNVYEIYCDGDLCLPYVNGRLMNTASGLSVTSGRICLQSEGTPIEYRNIFLLPVRRPAWRK